MYITWTEITSTGLRSFHVAFDCKSIFWASWKYDFFMQNYVASNKPQWGILNHNLQYTPPLSEDYGFTIL